MSLQHVFVYPKVTEVGHAQPTVTAVTPRSVARRRLDRPTQREMVMASLLRCPEQTSAANATKRA
jgi:hypothetical protein